MQRNPFNRLAALLAFACIVEFVAGLAMLATTAYAVRLLLGAEAVGVALAMGRAFGIAILALGLACWPSGREASAAGRAWRGMLAYNAMVASCLAWLGFAHGGGLLLWPAVGLHAATALLLILAALHEDRQ
ncbi:hypothetical protein WKW80_24315 [Variovorax humicola]|uniref:Uncharacterized protein n=1 Tax=Variovorax humicola TaxID=1769758 RepID=A0ABU8W542_9BURK